MKQSQKIKTTEQRSLGFLGKAVQYSHKVKVTEEFYYYVLSTFCNIVYFA